MVILMLVGRFIWKKETTCAVFLRKYYFDDDDDDDGDDDDDDRRLTTDDWRQTTDDRRPTTKWLQCNEKIKCAQYDKVTFTTFGVPSTTMYFSVSSSVETMSPRLKQVDIQRWSKSCFGTTSVDTYININNI